MFFNFNVSNAIANPDDSHYAVIDAVGDGHALDFPNSHQHAVGVAIVITVAFGAPDSAGIEWHAVSNAAGYGGALTLPDTHSGVAGTSLFGPIASRHRYFCGERAGGADRDGGCRERLTWRTARCSRWYRARFFSSPARKQTRAPCCKPCARHGWRPRPRRGTGGNPQSARSGNHRGYALAAARLA